MTAISINNLTINVNGAPARQNPLEALLAGLAIHAVRADGNEDASDLNKDEESTLKYDLVAFLQPNDKFTFRTLSAIAKQFSDYQLIELKTALDELVSEGAVATKRRRADGETLYVADVESYADVVGDQIRAAHAAEAAAQAEQADPAPTHADTDTENEAPAPRPVPFLTREAIVSFLRSDERYERRSEGAVQRHFSDQPADDVRRALANVESWGYIESHRGRDGVTYYSAN